ncbi:hypothetical protein Tco_0499628 [Tanacetum coccineum]
MEKIFQIFQDLRFDISFADALLLMPRFSPMIKSLIMNKEKLLELAKIPLNENCSAMLLKKLLEKLRDPGKFLIPYNFPGMDVCHTLSVSNKDECLTPGDDIEFLLHHDPSTPLKSIASILEGFINEPPFEENDDLFDLESKTNDWKRILYDAPIDEAKCFDPGSDND